MSKLTIFYLERCPYCRSARKAVRELQSESDAYRAIEIEWIEESRAPEIANGYDYYYVPSVFRGTDKLYECSPAEGYEAIKAHIRLAMDAAAK